MAWVAGPAHRHRQRGERTTNCATIDQLQPANRIDERRIGHDLRSALRIRHEIRTDEADVVVRIGRIGGGALPDRIGSDSLARIAVAGSAVKRAGHQPVVIDNACSPHLVPMDTRFEG